MIAKQVTQLTNNPRLNHEILILAAYNKDI